MYRKFISDLTSTVALSCQSLATSSHSVLVLFGFCYFVRWNFNLNFGILSSREIGSYICGFYSISLHRYVIRVHLRYQHIRQGSWIVLVHISFRLAQFLSIYLVTDYYSTLEDILLFTNLSDLYFARDFRYIQDIWLKLWLAYRYAGCNHLLQILRRSDEYFSNFARFSYIYNCQIPVN